MRSVECPRPTRKRAASSEEKFVSQTEQMAMAVNISDPPTTSGFLPYLQDIKKKKKRGFKADEKKRNCATPKETLDFRQWLVIGGSLICRAW